MPEHPSPEEAEATSAAAAVAGAGSGSGPVLTAAGATRTAVVQYVARALSLLAVVIGTSMVTRRLGNEFADWGTVILCVTIAGVLVEPGLAAVIVRRLASEPDQAPSLRAMYPVRLALGCLAFVVVVVLAVVARGPGIFLLAVCIGAQVIARSLVNNGTSWLQVDLRLHRLALLEALCVLLGLGALTGGIAADLPVPVLGALAFTVPTFLLLVLMQPELRRTPSMRLPPSGAQRAKVRSVLVEVAPLALAIGLSAVYTRTSIIFVNRFEDDAAASRFFFAFLFAEQSFVIAGITAGALLPLLAARSKVADLLSDDVTQRLLVGLTALGALACALLIAFSRLLVVLIGGPELAGAEEYIRLVAPTVAVVMPAMVIGYVYISVGRVRSYLVFGTIGLVGNLVLNVLLVPTFGAEASARITWATELLVALLPLTAVLRSGPSGHRAAVRMAVIFLAAVAASELSAAGTFSPWAMALALVAVCVVVGQRAGRWMLGEIVRRR